MGVAFMEVLLYILVRHNFRIILSEECTIIILTLLIFSDSIMFMSQTLVNDVNEDRDINYLYLYRKFKNL